MNYTHKIVTQMPLTTLWTTEGEIAAVRRQWVSVEQIWEKLQQQTVQFVMADIGQKLIWVAENEVLHVLKTELNPHLAPDPGHINLDDFPGQYAYVASVWTEAEQREMVLFEKYH